MRSLPNSITCRCFEWAPIDGGSREVCVPHFSTISSVFCRMSAYSRISDEGGLHAAAMDYSYLQQGTFEGSCSLSPMDLPPSCQLPASAYGSGDLGSPCSGSSSYRYSVSPMARSYSAPPSGPSCGMMSARPRPHLHPDHPTSMVAHHAPPPPFPGLQNLPGE